MTIQRGLKATGTFSYQTAVCGRGATYEQFIQPTLEIVLQAAEWLERFPDSAPDDLGSFAHGISSQGSHNQNMVTESTIGSRVCCRSTRLHQPTRQSRW